MKEYTIKLDDGEIEVLIDFLLRANRLDPLLGLAMHKNDDFDIIIESSECPADAILATILKQILDIEGHPVDLFYEKKFQHEEHMY